MHAAKCVLDLNRNDPADSLDFNINLKTNPTDMIQFGAYTQRVQNSPIQKSPKHQKKVSEKQSHTKQSKTI